MPTSKRCLKCGEHHLFLAACDPKKRQAFLARMFGEDGTAATEEETSEIAKYKLRRRNP